MSNTEDRPTNQAKSFFDTAQLMLRLGEQDFGRNSVDRITQRALQGIVAGLDAMATAQRATYMLLEDVKKLLERQNA